MRESVVHIVVAAAVTFCSVGCRNEAPSEANYVARISGARDAKDAAFKSQSEPVPKNLKNELLPLAYYFPDAQYDVPAVLTPSGDTTPLQMVYSDGAIRYVTRVGALKFIVNGERHQLGAFIERGASNLNNELFVPFGDLTNGTETYHSGRMLDVERTATGLYELDFNRAYNPNCYFSPNYSCPIPPKENRLQIPIQAGEKIKVTR